MSPKQQHTNQQQFSSLIEFMRENEGIAKGALNAPEYKFHTSQLWEGITTILNGHGPPTKNADGWKKVWKDFKYNIKKKLRHNTKCIRGTGGGPNNQHVLSKLEEEIMVLLDLQTCENGMNVETFGLNQEKQSNPLQTTNDMRPSTPRDIDEYEETTLLPDFQTEEFVVPENETFVSSSAFAGGHPSKARTPSATAKKLLEKQVQQQNNYQTKRLELLANQNKELHFITDELKKTRRIKEQEIKLLKRKIDIKEKENKDMLKIRLDELQIKKRKLELRERELGIYYSP